MLTILIAFAVLLSAVGMATSSIYIVSETEPNRLTIRLKGEDLKDIEVGVNGTFFCTKRRILANWVVRDGKTLYPFPWWDAKERGCLVIFKNGKVYLGLVKYQKGKLFTKDGREIKENEIKLAVGGCSYFLRDGRLATYTEMRKEGFPPSVIESTSFSFLAWNEKKNKIALGVSYGLSLRSVGIYLNKLGYKNAIRLDGGSATGVWRQGRKFPKTINIVAVRKS